MAINLLNIEPHVVSRDLGGYITFLYGGYKTGKTTLATQMDGALLLAFEQGYNALPGVMSQDITTWGEMKLVYRELKKPEVKATYKAVVVDTIDVAADKCKKYICQQNGIEELGDLGYGKGWSDTVHRHKPRLGRQCHPISACYQYQGIPHSVGEFHLWHEFKMAGRMA